MLAFALLAMMPMQESAPVESAPVESAPVESVPVESAPVESAPVESAPVESAPVESAPVVDACLTLVHEGKRIEAQRCYAERAQGDDAKARLARELADVVATLELRPPTLAAEPEPETSAQGFDVGGLVLSGKAELIATSTLVGGYMATTAAVGGLGVVCGGFGCGGPLAGGLLLAPVVGGGLGLGVSTATMLAVDSLGAGDVNVVRATMLLGTFDSILVFVLATSSGGFSNGPAAAAAITFGMFATQAAGIGAGFAIASFTELPEGAGSLALSTGLWTSVVTVLGANMFGLLRQPSAPQMAFLMMGTANIGFAGGMIASSHLPVSRAETWAIDVGGAVGLLAGASLAFQTKAPNPFIGWGTMALGTGVGMGAGFAAARWLPPLVGDMPQIVAFSPVIVDDVDPSRSVRGAMVTGRF